MRSAVFFPLLLGAAMAWGAPGPADDARSSAALPRLTIDDSPTTNPWTHLRVNNDPMNFQFAIVTDRSGGLRPGVFEDAVRKLNLLQPEFVMSVGDLISGYTKQPEELDRQWDEFESFVARLKMPFFYVPGNHDMANPVQQEAWVERFGRPYYHFVYGNVLFLCLNSEDPTAELSRKQIDYFDRVLEENRDVRWTLVFLHRPLWVGSEKTRKGNGWQRFESLLKGRPHTVYAGHLHQYTKHVRNNTSYIVLATTGGGSSLRGARPYGEFDHVAWITMTDEGPVMANIALEGIWDEDVRTADLARLVDPLTREAVLTRPMVTEPFPFTSATTQLRLTNHSDFPLKLRIRFEQHDSVQVQPSVVERTVPPNSVEFADVAVKARREVRAGTEPEPLRLAWHGEIDPPGQEKIVVDGTRQIIIDPVRPVAARTSPVTLDGKLEEWGSLPVSVTQPAVVAGRKGTWKGPEDVRFRFAVESDDRFVYVALRLDDDRVVEAAPGEPGVSDQVEIRLDPSGSELDDAVFPPTSKKALRRKTPAGRARGKGELKITLAPGETTATEQGGYHLQGAAVRTPTGYTAEAAFPIEALRAEQGDEWDSLRINIVVHDQDRPGLPGQEEKSLLWWRPDSATPASWPNAGTFVKP